MFGKNTIIPTILLDASFPVPLRMESFSKKRSMTVWDDSSIPFIPEVTEIPNPHSDIFMMKMDDVSETSTGLP